MFQKDSHELAFEINSHLYELSKNQVPINWLIQLTQIGDFYLSQGLSNLSVEHFYNRVNYERSLIEFEFTKEDLRKLDDLMKYIDIKKEIVKCIGLMENDSRATLKWTVGRIRKCWDIIKQGNMELYGSFVRDMKKQYLGLPKEKKTKSKKTTTVKKKKKNLNRKKKSKKDIQLNKCTKIFQRVFDYFYENKKYELCISFGEDIRKIYTEQQLVVEKIKENNISKDTDFMERVVLKDVYEIREKLFRIIRKKFMYKSPPIDPIEWMNISENEKKIVEKEMKKEKIKKEKKEKEKEETIEEEEEENKIDPIDVLLESSDDENIRSNVKFFKSLLVKETTFNEEFYQEIYMNLKTKEKKDMGEKGEEKIPFRKLKRHGDTMVEMIRLGKCVMRWIENNESGTSLVDRFEVDSKEKEMMKEIGVGVINTLIEFVLPYLRAYERLEDLEVTTKIEEENDDDDDDGGDEKVVIEKEVENVNLDLEEGSVVMIKKELPTVFETVIDEKNYYVQSTAKKTKIPAKKKKTTVKKEKTTKKKKGKKEEEKVITDEDIQRVKEENDRIKQEEIRLIKEMSCYVTPEDLLFIYKYNFYFQTVENNKIKAVNDNTLEGKSGNEIRPVSKIGTRPVSKKKRKSTLGSRKGTSHGSRKGTSHGSRKGTSHGKREKIVKKTVVVLNNTRYERLFRKRIIKNLDFAILYLRNNKTASVDDLGWSFLGLIRKICKNFVNPKVVNFVFSIFLELDFYIDKLIGTRMSTLVLKNNMPSKIWNIKILKDLARISHNKKFLLSVLTVVKRMRSYYSYLLSSMSIDSTQEEIDSEEIIKMKETMLELEFYHTEILFRYFMFSSKMPNFCYTNPMYRFLYRIKEYIELIGKKRPFKVIEFPSALLRKNIRDNNFEHILLTMPETSSSQMMRRIDSRALRSTSSTLGSLSATQLNTMSDYIKPVYKVFGKLLSSNSVDFEGYRSINLLPSLKDMDSSKRFSDSVIYISDNKLLNCGVMVTNENVIIPELLFNRVYKFSIFKVDPYLDQLDSEPEQQMVMFTHFTLNYELLRYMYFYVRGKSGIKAKEKKKINNEMQKIVMEAKFRSTLFSDYSVSFERMVMTEEK